MGAPQEVLDALEGGFDRSVEELMALPDVIGACLDTQDRGEYCASVGDEVLSTRFGFDECAERYDAIEGRYARRFAKKHCAAIYRVIAGRCRPLGDTDQP